MEDMSADPFAGMPAGGGAQAAFTMPESNKLREWEDAHSRELEEGAMSEAKKKEETRQAAMDALKQWNADRQANISKRSASNRSEEKLKEPTMTEKSNPWESVVDLIDVAARDKDDGADTSRMRSLLIQLKSNPKMPSAA
eukprot:CAMPEP_0178413684 /NCGR_PEP_ID=MMETSP0689_2-20121128/22654_1 /TAXON_ID=160604 /ORGANISM="Amphidinium massartii, Strain CS-259" /LENGTH=139 /DNA_ID=CAMNT_0020034963 /DNA_START=84 /DNA_END=503 /DNA_ORIENTATION=-